jgi:hypothetical protein
LFPTIECNLPQADGSEILFLFCTTQGSSPVGVNVHISTTKIDVLLATGSGQNFTSREFSGSGVHNFDPAAGTQISSTLTEISAASAKRGTIGAVTSVKGTVDCGNQTVGSSTVIYSGSATEGAINGGASPFRVECDNTATNKSVSFTGVVKIGTTPVLFITTLTASSVTTFMAGGGTPPIQHAYRLQATEAATLSGTGAHVTANLVETSATSGPPHTLHLEGDLVCGTVMQS